MTFTRRRLALLDWLEEHTAPVSFTDSPSHTGIAVGIASQRMRLDRETLRLSVTDQEASPDPLREALRGTWMLVEPQNAVLTHFHGVWTFTLDRDYDDARHALTHRTVPAAFGPDVDAYDTAALVEVKTRQGAYSLEFGVVSAEELVERMSNVSMGLMQTTPENRAPVQVELADVPSVSLFCDVGGHFRKPVASHDELLREFHNIHDEVSRLVTAVGRTL